MEYNNLCPEIKCECSGLYIKYTESLYICKKCGKEIQVENKITYNINNSRNYGKLSSIIGVK